MSITYDHQKLINLFVDIVRESKEEVIYSTKIEDDKILFLSIADNKNFALLVLKSLGLKQPIFEVEIEELREISGDDTSINFYKKGKCAPILTVQVKPSISLQCEAE